MSVVYKDAINPVAGKVVVKQTTAGSISITTQGFSDNIGIEGYIIYIDGEKYPLVISQYGQLNFDYTRANLAGKLNISVIAFDAYSNESKAVKSSITIKDMTRPESVTGLSVKAGADQKVATLTWDKGIDNVGVTSYVIYVDGKKYTSKNNSLSVKRLSAGYHTFSVIAVDKAKNSSYVSDGYDFYVADTTVPKNGKVFVKQTSADSISITTENFSDNVGIAKYHVYIDGANSPVEVYANQYGQLNFDYTRANLAGKLNVSVIAFDAAGNQSKAAKSSITIKDVTNPESVTGLSVEAGADQKIATLTWDKGVDNVGVTSYVIYVDGKKYTSKTNSLSVKGLSAGYHTYTVVAVDKAKNSSEFSQEYNFYVEDITNPKNGKVFIKQTNAGSISITTGNFYDNVGISKYLVYIDGEQSPIEIDADQNGQLNYEYTRADLAGKLNVSVIAFDDNDNQSKAVKSSITIQNAVIKDVIKPEKVTGLSVDISSDPQTATLTWDNGIDNTGVTSYEIYVDGKKYTSTVNSLTVNGLDYGDHSFYVFALDLAKNKSVVSSTCSFAISEKTSYTDQYGNNVININKGYAVKVRAWEAFEKDLAQKGKGYSQALQTSITGTDDNDIINFPKEKFVYVEGNISLGKGDDVINLIGDSSRDNYTELQMGGNIDFGDGNNVFNIQNARFDCGVYVNNDESIFDESSNYSIKFGSGDDKFNITDAHEVEWGNNISFGAGNDSLTIKDSQVSVDESYKSTLIDLGSGNDKLTLNGNSSLEIRNDNADASLSFGAGNDTLDIQEGSNLILLGTHGDNVDLDFGDGVDTLNIDGCLIVGHAPNALRKLSEAEVITGNGYLIAPDWVLYNCSDVLDKFEDAGINVRGCGDYHLHSDFDINMYNNNIKANAQEATEFYEWGDGDIESYLMGEAWSDANSLRLDANAVDWYRFTIGNSETDEAIWNTGSFEFEYNEDSCGDSDVIVEIQNSAGKIIKTFEFERGDEKSYSLSSLAAGEYFMKISLEDENSDTCARLSVGYEF